MKIANNVKVWALTLALMVAGVVLMPGSVMANVKCLDGTTKPTLSDCGYADSDVAKVDGNEAAKKIINLFIGVVGFLAVVFIIYGGFLYTTSAGDSSKVTKAKNTIMYGVIGLVVALLAFAIVNFVLTSLFTQ